MSFRPNPIDTMLLGFIDRCGWSRSGKRGHSSDLSRLQRSMIRCIINFVDLQLIAGLGILISGFLSLNNDLSAYHWSILVYLAWLSSITHLSGLTALRGYFHSRRWEREWRLALMFILLVLLLVAMGPMAFFNWERSFPSDGAVYTVALPIFPARCYFSPGEILKSYYELIAPGGAVFSRSLSFQSMITSMTLLVLNFFSRVLRIFRFISNFFVGRVRRAVRDLAKRALCTLSTPIHPLDRMLNERQWHFIVVKPCLAMFLTIRLYVDLFVSTLSEIYWLLISSSWATTHLHGVRSAASKQRRIETRTEWTFGQTLPVLMLLGPAIMAVATFVKDSELTDTSPGHHRPVDLESADRPARQDCQSSSRAGDSIPRRAIARGRSGEQHRNDTDCRRFPRQHRARVSPTRVTMQLDVDPNSQELEWLQRDYYKSNWAPTICFWFSLQICTVGSLIVTLSVLNSYYDSFSPSNTSPLTMIRMMWVWVLVAQPATTFALILFNITGQDFRGARKWLNHPLIGHGFAFTLYGLGILTFLASLFQYELVWDSHVGRPALVLFCVTFVPSILLYGILMFFVAK